MLVDHRRQGTGGCKGISGEAHGPRRSRAASRSLEEISSCGEDRKTPLVCLRRNQATTRGVQCRKGAYDDCYVAVEVLKVETTFAAAIVRLCVRGSLQAAARIR